MKVKIKVHKSAGDEEYLVNERMFVATTMGQAMLDAGYCLKKNEADITLLAVNAGRSMIDGETGAVVELYYVKFAAEIDE